MDRIYRCVTANGYRLNPYKSKCLTIRNRAFDFNIVLDIIISGENSNFVNVAKNVGLNFNNNLTWSNHVNTLVGQTYIKLSYLWSA